MPVSRAELSAQLAELDRSVEDLRADYTDEGDVVEAVASQGDDIAAQAGPDRCWVEDQVEEILRRHGLLLEGAGAPGELEG
ncbi:MAG TPA: hypothetical protein VD865_14710 [Stenotrophomonas sp.]|nr:hypothetical protein [Stenotrophomonas sp.]